MRIGENYLDKLDKLRDQDIPNYHDRFYLTARILKQSYLDHPEYVIDKMYEASEQCGYRPPGPGEIERIVKYVWANEPTESYKPMPVTDHTLIAEVCKNADLSTMKAQSKTPPDSINQVLDDLYEDDPYLCIAENVFDTHVKRKSEWKKMDLTKYQFLLPNPLKDSSSRRSDNIAEVRYLTYECDQMGRNWDAQSACLIKLAKMVFLKCATFSGGKSIHGLYRVRGYSSEHIERFLELAHRLGGDPATLKPQQLVRLPNGWRKDTNKPQKILYYA